MTPHAYAASACLALLLTSCTTATASRPAEEPGVTIDRVVTISDGDHVAGTYVDGVLAPPDAGHRDQLTTLRVVEGEVRAAQVEVPNSVTAAPEVLALSPDSGTAFVAERLARRGPGDTTADQLEPGNRLTAVTVSDLAAPAVAATTTVADSPEALGISPDGRRIAVVANTPDAAVLQLVDWNGSDRTFGRSQQFDLADLGVTGTSPGPRAGVLVTNVHWHPTGRALAVNIDSQDRVAFFLLDDDVSGTTTVRPWGSPVPTGTDPFAGRFTPDGRHYVTANWGRNLATTVAADRLPRGRSTLSVIQVGAIDDGAAVHRVVGAAESDTSSEGLAISPDGTLVATVNMRGTTFPPGSPRHDEQASVSLLRLDPATGALRKIGDSPLDAVLPEGGTFDASGDYFIATSFEGRAGRPGGPGLQVYRVEPASGLVPVQRIPLQHGVHHVVVG